MANANKGIFTGRIARKEMRRSDTTAIANITLAVNYYDRKAKQECPIFINASVFGKMAENMDNIADVGDLVYLEGEWRPNNWTSKTTGEKHNELRLSVVNWEFLRKKGDRSGASAGTTTSTPAANSTMGNPMDGFYPMDDELGDDDLPF